MTLRDQRGVILYEASHNVERCSRRGARGYFVGTRRFSSSCQFRTT